MVPDHVIGTGSTPASRNTKSNADLGADFNEHASRVVPEKKTEELAGDETPVSPQEPSESRTSNDKRVSFKEKSKMLGKTFNAEDH